MQRLEVILPEPPFHNPCGNARRSRMYQDFAIEGAHLSHLARFFERVQDDDEIEFLHVSVRNCTLQFFGAPGFYSAEVGSSYDDDDAD